MNQPAHTRRIDIIVPIYKNAPLVRACVDSLLEHLHEVAELQPRLILINDSPGDEGIEALLHGYAAHGEGLLIWRNDQNLGFVRSVNRGLMQARRDGHDALLVNSDTLTFAGTLTELLKAARADPQVGFASPRSNNASICSLPHFHGGLLPTPQQAHERWRVLSRAMPAFHFAPTAVGFYMFIAHSVLANHGGLSEDFGVGYEEENDLVMRAGKVGQRALLVNHAFAYHAGSASFSLTNLDLQDHKNKNLSKLSGMHPEFLPLVRRYEGSARYRAEALMAGLLPEADGRIRVVFDLTGMGQHHNGTNEHTICVLRSLVRRWHTRLRIAGVASAASFKFHGLDLLEGLHREEPGTPGQHGIALRLGQPFDIHHLNVLESVAPINVFAMLDTIAEDCGPLAAANDTQALWAHAAVHSNGLLFNGRFSEQTFCNRHPPARALPRMAQLLPTQLASYSRNARAAGSSSHVFVLGNHFAHKGSDVAARRLAAAYPTMKFVVLGAETFQSGNLTSYRSGGLEQDRVDELFKDASVVVLPSYVEGFGLGFMHALAAGRPIVARRIPAIEEILATLEGVEGVFLFDNDDQLVSAFNASLQATASRAVDTRGASWDDWSDAVAEFCLELVNAGDVFDRLVGRIAAGDLLRKAAASGVSGQEAQRAEAVPSASSPPAGSQASGVDLDALMSMNGRTFVEHAYTTLLRRPADESGLAFYMSELDGGVKKVEILRALHTSPEGHARGVKLDGLDALLAKNSVRPRFLKRIFSA
jgi:GT2 family glycosyltransferase